MSLAVVAPAGAGAAAYVMIGFSIFFTYVAVVAMQKGYEATLGFFLRMLRNAVKDVSFIGGYLAGRIDAADDYIMDHLGQARADVESMLTKWWHGMEWIVRETYNGIVAFGEDVHGAIDGIVHGTIPSLIHGATHVTVVKVTQVERTVTKRIVQTQHGVQARVNGLSREWDEIFGKALRGIDYIRNVALPRVWHGIRGAEADIASLRRYAHRGLSGRIGRLERLLLGTVFAAGVLATLNRVFPWWQCSSVRRFNKLLCGTPLNLLDDLFGLALLFMGPLSIVGFARQLQEVTGAVADGVGFFITEA